MRLLAVLLALALFLLDPGMVTFGALLFAEFFDWTAIFNRKRADQ